MSSIALARIYQQSFDSHPYGTLAFTNGALSAIGDAVAQAAQNLMQPRRAREANTGYDFTRTLRFFVFGFGMGPLIGRWNFFLERNFPLRVVGAPIGTNVSIPQLTKRVASDQLVMAPIGLVLFLGSMGIMEGRDAPHIRRKFKDLYVPLLLNNWTVWPLAQLINFRYMPLAYRVPFQSTCGVFWTLYLSIANSREEQHQIQEDLLQKTLKPL